MAAQELMARGRKDIKETDASLARSEKVVAETIAIGAATAATLDAQAWSPCKPQSLRLKADMPCHAVANVHGYPSQVYDGDLALKDLKGVRCRPACASNQDSVQQHSTWGC